MILLFIIIGVLVICFGLIVLRGAPYVPTLRAQLATAFDDVYPVTTNDLVVDLGSGDGVVLAAAAERGARAIGYELNPILWLLSTWRFRYNDAVTVVWGDFRRLDTLPNDTTLVYAFATSHSIDQIGRKLEQWSQERQVYCMSYGFTLDGRTLYKQSGPMNLYTFGPKA